MRPVELPNELSVTDAGLAHPVALERFEALNLNGTKVTAAGIVHFVKVVPSRRVGNYRMCRSATTTWQTCTN